MNVAPYHIQNVIRAYCQRTGRLRGLGKITPDGSSHSVDTITISPEAKQRQVAETVGASVVSRARGQGQTARLDAHIHGGLDSIERGGRKDGFQFRVIDADNGEILKQLSPEDTERVLGRLYESAESMTKTGDTQELIE